MRWQIGAFDQIVSQLPLVMAQAAEIWCTFPAANS